MSSLSPMGGGRAPKDAEPVRNDEGTTVIGWIKLRMPIGGNPTFPGWDTYKGHFGRPWTVFETRDEAVNALRTWRRDTGDPDLDWKPGEP
jgi:hypothetical protein